MNNHDKIQDLKIQIKMFEKIGKTCRELLRELKNTDYKAMDAFKPYIRPKENINSLLEFYDQYSTSVKNIESIRIKIEKSEIEKKIFKIKELEELQIILLMDDLKKHLEELNNYKEIKIVQHVIEANTEYFSQIVDCIKKSFFNALNRLPKIVNKIDVYAHFILHHTDTKEFLAEYTQKVYRQLGFLGINNNFTALIQQTLDLTKYFNLVTQMNVEILGKRVAYNINVGLVQLIIINLKKVIAETLMRVEKEHKPKDISNLIKLHNNLNHKDGPKITEIEELFVFKDQIKILISNCLAQYLADLELLESPRTDAKTEKMCLIMENILNAFEENKALKSEWAQGYGPSFGIYDAEKLDSNLSNKCLMKISILSTQLKDFEKYIYLINNKSCLRKYIKEFEKMPIKKSINKDVQLIIGLWKIRLEAYKGITLNRYLTGQLDVHAKYILPEHERTKVQEALKSVVESLIVRKTLEGHTTYLKEAIENTYMGK